MHLLGCFENNIDYTGHDVRFLQAASALECQELCLERTDCFYFTFLHGSMSCALKSREAIGGRSSLPDATSGPRECRISVGGKKEIK